MEKSVIRQGKWSVCYKQGDKFIKEYIYTDKQAIQREALASNSAWISGLLTPRYIKSCILEGKECAIFEYIDMQALNEETVCTPFYMEQIKKILALFEGITWEKDDSYWYNQLNDFYDALYRIEDEINLLISFLQSLTPATFIHGDFTCDNLGIFSQNIFVFDFQHGSLGPIGWDKAYLASTLTPENSQILGLNETEKKMASVISAIRYGRSIRKSSADKCKRQTLYLLWKQSVIW